MAPLQAYVQPHTLKDVDPDSRNTSTWVRVIWKAHDIPDRIVCSITPPTSGNVLEVLVKLEYSGPKSTPLARSLYEELIHRLTERYGAERVNATKM